MMAADNKPKYRVLIVEDEPLIALMIEDALADMECDVLGPVGKLDTALQYANDREFDAAILDVAIDGGRVFPVAEQLVRRGIPFVFASGHGDWVIPEGLRNQPRLTKPFAMSDLEDKIRWLRGEIERLRGSGKI